MTFSELLDSALNRWHSDFINTAVGAVGLLIFLYFHQNLWNLNDPLFLKITVFERIALFVIFAFTFGRLANIIGGAVSKVCIWLFWLVCLSPGPKGQHFEYQTKKLQFLGSGRREVFEDAEYIPRTQLMSYLGENASIWNQYLLIISHETFWTSVLGLTLIAQLSMSWNHVYLGLISLIPLVIVGFFRLHHKKYESDCLTDIAGRLRKTSVSS
jgi:hypothetical protein